MTDTSIDLLTQTIQSQWPSMMLSNKVKAYVGKFTNRVRIGSRIVAQVLGNYGTYTVSIEATSSVCRSACGCYIGKSGNCHHCAALAFTFLYNPDSFIEKIPKKLEDVKGLADVNEYLQGVTLASLLGKLKENGISQKAFAASLGTSTQHLSAVKSSELNNRFYHGLGATKLACLWILEHYGETKKNKG